MNDWVLRVGNRKSMAFAELAPSIVARAKSGDEDAFHNGHSMALFEFRSNGSSSLRPQGSAYMLTVSNRHGSRRVRNPDV